MNDVLVTIGIPVYNVGNFIEYTLNSVLHQTYTNFELIITDDGSTDNTVEIIRSFDDSRINLVVDGKHQGISSRLNQQIELAKGKYFIRMDGDDLMFPDRIEKQISFLQSHPNVDVVGASAVVIGEDNIIVGIRGKKSILIKKSEVFGSTRFIHPTVAGKTDWFKRWKYRQEMDGCEDMDLWIRSFDFSNFADLNIPVIFYRDPLKFKIKTYLFREIQIIKCIFRLRKETNSLFVVPCGMAKSILSMFIGIVLHLFGGDKYMIARRNSIISNREYNQYFKILSRIIS